MVPILFVLFFVSLLSGQLIRIPIYQSIVIYPHDIILGILTLIWFLRRKTNTTYTPPMLLFPLSMWLLAVLISIAAASTTSSWTDLFVGFGYLVRFFLYTALYFIVREEKIKEKFVQLLYATGIGFMVLGLFQYILYPNLRNLSYLGWDPHYWRLFSTFLDPNFAGLFLVLTFILGCVFFENRKYHTFLILSQLLILVSILLTISRSSILSLGIVSIMFIFIKKSWKYLIGILFVIVVLMLFPFPYRDITPLTRVDSSLARIGNWEESVQRIQSRPILGYGFNMLRSIQDPASHAGGGVDNSFLFVAVTTGIVGFIAWLYLYGSMVRLGLRAVGKKETEGWGYVYILSLLAITVHSMFLNSFFYPWILIWLWTLTGYVEANVGKQKSEDRKQK